MQYESYFPLTAEELKDAYSLRDLFTKEFEFFDDVYDLTTMYLSNSKILSTDANKVVASALLIRAIEAARTVKLAACIGLCADASATSRTLIELLSILANAASEPAFLEKYAKSSLTDGLRLHNAIRTDPENRVLSDDKSYDSLKKEVDAEGAKKLPTVETLLKSVELNSAYDFAYRVHSGDVHVSPYSLNTYYTEDAQGEVTGFYLYPHEDEVPTVIVGSASTLFECLVSWSKVIGVDVSERAVVEKRRKDFVADRRK